MHPCRQFMLLRADVGRLPFRSESLGAIHAGAALHCWPNPSQAVRVPARSEPLAACSSCVAVQRVHLAPARRLRAQPNMLQSLHTKHLYSVYVSRDAHQQVTLDSQEVPCR